MCRAKRRCKIEPALIARFNRLLSTEGLVYSCMFQVKHLLWIVVREVGMERLKDEVQITLGDLHIAPFYGCYILRPSWDVGFDDLVHQTSIEMQIRTEGAERLEYLGLVICCA